MKTLLLILVFFSFALAQEHSIYFENFESIEFDTTKGLKTLSFTFNRDSGLVKVIIIKQSEKSWVVGTLKNGDYTSIVPINNIRWMMPELISKYTGRYPKAKLEDIEKIVRLIY